MLLYSEHRFLKGFHFGLMAVSGLLLNNSLHAREQKNEQPNRQ